jgi:SagB-type dehydrogenase family enzyme
MKRGRGERSGRRAGAREADALTARARAASGEEGSQLWYVAEGKRGQQLLDEGQVGEATQVFASILARVGDAPSYGRAVILGRLGRCVHLGGRPDLAVTHLREAIGVTVKLAPGEGVKGLRGTLHSELGDALRALGQYGGAREAYEAALKAAEELHDLRGQGVDLGHLGALALAGGKPEEAQARYRAALLLFRHLHEPAMEAVAWHQLGRVFQEQRRWDEAERHYREAARIAEERGNLAGAAQIWNQLAILNQEAGRPEAAEGWYQKAIGVDRQIGNPMQVGRRLSNLADLLQNQPGRLVEARELAEVALAIAQTADPVAAEVWTTYGILADITDKEAATTAESQRSAALRTRARDYRQLHRYAPLIQATLARLGGAPSFGRAVILGRLGQCFRLGGRPDLAVAHSPQAIAVAEQLAPSEGVKSLRGTLHSELGEALGALGQYAEARKAYEAALKIAEDLRDLRGQNIALRQLGALALAEGQCEEAQARYREVARISEERGVLAGSPVELGAESSSLQAGSSVGLAQGFEVTLYEDLITDYGFDTNLLVDGPRQRRIIRWSAEPDPLADDVRPMLVPCARIWVHDEGAVRFRLPLGEPVLERHPGCIVMRRTRREVAVSGNSGVLWGLIRAVDGDCTVGAILSRFPPGERPVAARMLAALAATDTIDVSGRPIGRYLHSATKKGVLPGGGLESDEVLRLATDGTYRAYPGAPRIAVSQSVPDRLQTFHALTRSRRSRRDYMRRALGREDFDALLYTACGVTGAMPWAGREVKLRAYPSSGALYAVEIYPIVFRVEGMEQGVYHYRAVENVLEVVRPGIDLARVVDAALPVEREMVAGAAAMVCLVGFFLRHEQKYGEGGYRMLVAEAGHISQNLVLAATALGLSARPFGGVFDDLLNHDLGLDEGQEQFLLSVLIGHTGGNDGR